MAEELVSTRPDLLLTGSDEAVRLLAQRTSTIPIVFAIGQDPVGNQLVASLQRPGGNATGLTSLASDLGSKRLQLLKEAFPRVTHVGLFFEPANVSVCHTAIFARHGPASSASRKKTREEEHSSYAPPPGPLGAVEVLGSIMINIMTITASFVEACNEYDHGQPLAKP